MMSVRISRACGYAKRVSGFKVGLLEFNDPVPPASLAIIAIKHYEPSFLGFPEALRKIRTENFQNSINFSI